MFPIPVQLKCILTVTAQNTVLKNKCQALSKRMKNNTAALTHCLWTIKHSGPHATSYINLQYALFGLDHKQEFRNNRLTTDKREKDGYRCGLSHVFGDLCT